MTSASAYVAFFLGGAAAIALAFGARQQGDRSRLAIAGAVLGLLALGIGVWSYRQTQRVERCKETYADLLAGRGDILQSFDATVKDCAGLIGG